MKAENKKVGFNILLLLAIVSLLSYYIFRIAPQITQYAKTPEAFRDYLLAYGNKSAWVFILFQGAQVILAVIPGEVFQIAGGYVFGTYLGTLYSVIGIIAGSMIAFLLAKLVGYSLVNKLVSKEVMRRYSFLMGSKKAEILIFVLFFIPGLPKDMLTYIAGCSPVKPFRFFSIVTIARLPAIFASSYVGAHLQTKQYTPVIVVSVIVGVLFLISILYKDKWIKAIKSHSKE